MVHSHFALIIHPRRAWRGFSPEQRLVSSLFLLAFFIGGLPETFTAAAANTLFIQTYGADSLPLVYIGVAAVVPLFGTLYLRCESLLPFARLLIATLLVNALVLGLLWLGWHFELRWVAFAAATWVHVEYVLTSLVLWGLAGRVLDVRQSKRAFGLVGIGELLAMMLGGLTTRWLVAWFSTPGLLWLSAASCVIGAWLVGWITRNLAPSLADTTPPSPHESSAGLLRGHDRPYILSILALSALGVVTYHFVDNAFYDSIERRYPTEDALAAYMGLFHAVVALVGLFYRLFLSELVFNRLGIRVAILLPPSLLLVGGGVVVLGGWLVGLTGWWFPVLVSGNKLLEQLGTEAIHKGVLLTLYQPLPPKRRTGVQVAVESFVEPLAGGLAGLVLLWCNKGLGFSARELTAASLVWVACWLPVAWGVYGRYVVALGRALERRRLEGEGPLSADAATVALLRQGLFSPKLQYSLYCLQWLDRHHNHHLVAEMPGLLSHPEGAVRREAAVVVERRQISTAWPAVRQALDREEDPAVRGQLLRALAAIGEDAALELITPFLRDPEVVVRRDALVAMFKHCGIEGIIVAGADLLQAAAATDPAQRCMVAAVVEAVADAHFYRILLRLVEDPDVSVRCAALDAGCKLAAVPRLQRAALRLLRQRETARKAEALLLAAGPVIIPELQGLLRDPGHPAWVRRRVIALLGQLPPPTPNAVLESFLETAPPGLRHAALQALFLLRHRVAPEHRLACVAMLRSEAADGAAWLAIVRDLGDAPALRLVRAGIDQELERGQERIFILLAMLHPLPALRDAWTHFASGVADKRAYAIEMIDTIIDPGLKGMIVPLLDDKSPGEKLKLLETFHPQQRLGLTGRLLALRTHPAILERPWLHANLVRASLELDPGHDLFFQLAVDLHRAEHPLLREMAAQTARYWPPAVAHAILTTLASDPDVRVAGMARSILTLLKTADPATGAIGGEMPMSTIEKVIFLKQVMLFSSIPEEHLIEIAHSMEAGEALPGEAIVRQGEWGNALYIIGGGQVRVVINDREVARMHEGEVFGELALLDPEPRSATVEAVDEVRYYRIDGPGFDEIMDLDPSVARNVIRMLCRRLRELNQRANQKGRGS
ncbi:MAG: cyclic nucleotide-binding domain-containing protein [Magnetococcales bacterium]|nr:cyclic nucleotide-binding domain-containing protein [Magnetococcales bacterium]